jgi:ABC-type arginine/histidine transport system permease subunit
MLSGNRPWLVRPSLLASALMSVLTIDDVISALDGIVQQAYDNSSRLGYFAALYRRVTTRCAME